MQIKLIIFIELGCERFIQCVNTTPSISIPAQIFHYLLQGEVRQMILLLILNWWYLKETARFQGYFRRTQGFYCASSSANIFYRQLLLRVFLLCVKQRVHILSPVVTVRIKIFETRFRKVLLMHLVASIGIPTQLQILRPFLWTFQCVKKSASAFIAIACFNILSRFQPYFCRGVFLLIIFQCVK